MHQVEEDEQSGDSDRDAHSDSEGFAAAHLVSVFDHSVAYSEAEGREDEDGDPVVHDEDDQQAFMPA